MPNARLRIIRTADITAIQANIRKINGCHEWLGKMERVQPVYYGWRVRRLLYTRLIRHTRAKIGLSCQNPLCINVAHMKAAVIGGSIAPYEPVMPDTRGTLNGLNILTEAEVLEIRDDYAKGDTTYKALGEEFGVHPSTVGLIVRGINWKWLENPNTL